MMNKRRESRQDWLQSLVRVSRPIYPLNNAVEISKSACAIPQEHKEQARMKWEANDVVPPAAGRMDARKTWPSNLALVGRLATKRKVQPFWPAASTLWMLR